MGFLSFLSPAITAASDVAGGYAQGQQRVDDTNYKRAVAAIAAKRQAEQDAVMNALHAAQTKAAGQIPVTPHDTENGVTLFPTRVDPSLLTPPTPTTSAGTHLATPIAPDPTASSDGEPKTADPSPSNTGGPLAPKPTAKDTIAAPVVQPPSPPTVGIPTGIKGPKKAPLPGTPEWKADLVTAAKIHKEYGTQPQDDRTLTPIQQPDGSVVYVKRADAVGQKVPNKAGQGGTGNLAAPMAAKVGQFGEMLKKASQLMPATDALNVSLGNSAAQDVATKGIGAFGIHVPGSQGLGSMMVNKSPEYSVYQAALSPFILAAAHALSGARINDTQVQQIRASVEIKPGDSPSVREQKHRNVIDLINSIGGSLPADAIGAQEDQMDPQAMMLMRGYGYKPANRKAVVPSTQASAGATDPTAGMSDADAWEAYRAQGLTPAQATAKVASRKK